MKSKISDIKEQGFKLIPDDIIVYGKKYRDTSTYININRKSKKIEAITWVMNLNNSKFEDYILSTCPFYY